jgi:DNA-binding MarR family transcriptional regulator
MLLMNQISEQQPSKTSGLSLLSLKNLNDKERHLVNWMRHQRICNLLDIAVHICQDEDTAFRMISPLLKKGLVVEIPGDDEPYYRVKIAPKRGHQIPEKLKGLLQKNRQEIDH